MTSLAVPPSSDVAVAMSDALKLLGKAGALSPTSLDLFDDMPFDRYEALAGLFGRVKRSTSWWLGDLLNFGEAAYGEKYAQAEQATGLSPSTLMNYSYVCRQVPKQRRVENVSFACHNEVAPLPPNEQKHWLKVASSEGLTQRELRERIKGMDAAPGDGGAKGGDSKLREVAAGLFHHAVKDGNGFHRVPSNWIAQLGATLGEENG